MTDIAAAEQEVFDRWYSRASLGTKILYWNNRWTSPEGDDMTAYRDRMLNGEYDPPKTNANSNTKTTTTKRATARRSSKRKS